VSSPEEYEVVVAGGGPAGAAAALCLTRTGHRVLLADSAHPTGFKIGEALPPAARTLLQDLNVWQRFRQEEHLPCPGNLAAWGSAHLHSTEFLLDPNGPGWHLDRARFDSLLRTAARTAGVDVREQTLLRCHTQEQGGAWQLGLTDRHGHEKIRCRWVIDATGRRCAIARSCGARRQRRDALIGLFVRLRPTPHACGRQDRDARTLIEAAPDGWWYTALTPNGHRVLTYLTDADLIYPSLHTPAGYLALLDQTHHLRHYMSAHGYTFETTPRGAPAQSSWLEPPIGEGWLAVGDAAISFDPLSAQGILTALFTGMTAGRALHAHLTGDRGALTAYRARLIAINAAYLRNRTTFYRLERRWPHHIFWSRRC
jgi:flavin-dependent dehydrogenase